MTISETPQPGRAVAVSLLRPHILAADMTDKTPAADEVEKLLVEADRARREAAAAMTKLEAITARLEEAVGQINRRPP